MSRPASLPLADHALRQARPAVPAAALFTATGFLSAALMFVLEPMAGKALLPEFGGGSSIWTSVMLFFQLTLLLGYALTHAGTRRLGPRGMAGVQLALAALALATLPARPAVLGAGLGPVASVLCTLACAYGPAPPVAWRTRLAWVGSRRCPPACCSAPRST